MADEAFVQASWCPARVGEVGGGDFNLPVRVQGILLSSRCPDRHSYEAQLEAG